MAIEYFDDEEAGEYGGAPSVEVKTYSEDGRGSLDELYTEYLRLADEHGWEMETVFCQRDDIEDGALILPVFSFRTKRHGPALWIVSGIHGDEPEGPMALVEVLDRIGALGNTIPMVVVPLYNPKGYRRNSDSQSRLQQNEDVLKEYVLRRSDTHPPQMTLNIHGDMSGIPLEKRIAAHRAVLQTLPELWKRAQQRGGTPPWREGKGTSVVTDVPRGGGLM
ncbi:succinylglutamate desuccinylase/aspartoacylase family protein [Candidatus Peregrinibacteria bacterium]|nr:succinylglutamate desuccinylase/aspartoacylase family protein [Candidatus Peregrinibacteria bacterium]